MDELRREDVPYGNDWDSAEEVAAWASLVLGILVIYFLLAAFIGSLAVSIDVSAGPKSPTGYARGALRFATISPSAWQRCHRELGFSSSDPGRVFWLIGSCRDARISTATPFWTFRSPCWR